MTAAVEVEVVAAVAALAIVRENARGIAEMPPPVIPAIPVDWI